MKLLSRDAFRTQVFERDKHKCVVCGEAAVDAHHILDRKLFKDGGYYLDNGVSLCSPHHYDAETSEISCEILRELAGITNIILPPDFKEGVVYDKWGEEQVEIKYRKYPRTYHFPWSEKATSDDKILSSLDGFIAQEIIQTVKLDGENTTMYNDFIHARSLSGCHHPSQDWVTGLWANIGYEIPVGWRICGENVYALHTIPYSNLDTYFYVYSIWNESNECLSWDETLEYCQLLNLTPVPVLYRGIFDIEKIKKNYQPYINGDRCEGYVVRPTKSFKYHEFSTCVGKFVSTSFEIAGTTHWSQKKVIPNLIRKPS